MQEDTVSINRLSDLAGCTHATARKKLEVAGAKPDKDNKYDLGTAIRALLASKDINEERKRLIVAQREKVERENEIAAGEWIHADEAYKAFAGVFIAMRETIRASHLSESEKCDLLKELRQDLLDAKSDVESKE
jgi:ribosomal protein S1